LIFTLLVLTSFYTDIFKQLGFDPGVVPIVSLAALFTDWLFYFSTADALGF
jgi:hypothetical protein